jgi:hypothetical protein
MERTLFGASLYISVRLIATAPRTLSHAVSSTIYNMWFLVSISSQPIVASYMKATSTIKTILDSGWFEFSGGSGSCELVLSASSSVSRYHTSFLGLTVFGGTACLAFLLLLV